MKLKIMHSIASGKVCITLVFSTMAAGNVSSLAVQPLVVAPRPGVGAVACCTLLSV